MAPTLTEGAAASRLQRRFNCRFRLLVFNFIYRAGDLLLIRVIVSFAVSRWVRGCFFAGEGGTC